VTDKMKAVVLRVGDGRGFVVVRRGYRNRPRDAPRRLAGVRAGAFFVGGMSGSPIVDANGAAIGVVSVSQSSPVILDSLSTQLARSIAAMSGAIGAPA
jgi:acetolactate synthase regulatory subunit